MTVTEVKTYHNISYCLYTTCIKHYILSACNEVFNQKAGNKIFTRPETSTFYSILELITINSHEWPNLT